MLVGPYVVDDVSVPNTACLSAMQRKILRGFDGHLHCEYQKDIVVGIARIHPFYGHSEDRGATWAVQDLLSGLAIDAVYVNLAVDSAGNPHIVYMDREAGKTYGQIKYLYRSNGTWSAIETLLQGVWGNNRTGGFDVGERVVGDVSGAEITIGWRSGAYLIPFGPSSDPGFIVNEWVRGQDSGARMRYQGLISRAQNISMGIDSSGEIHVVFYLNIAGVITRIAYINGESGAWYWPDSVMDQDEATAMGVGPSDNIHIVVQDDKAFYFSVGTSGSWAAKENFATGGTGVADYSMAVDLDGNAHVVMSQTGLGGTNDTVLNIKYYKRTAGVWGAIEHVTDDAVARSAPSIAVDTNGTIRVTFLGTGYGTEVANPNLVMRTKLSGGAWGAVEVLIDRVPTQYLPNMLHSLLPVSGSERPNCPDGYALIFNGQDTLKMEYLAEIIDAVSSFPQMCLT